MVLDVDNQHQVIVPPFSPSKKRHQKHAAIRRNPQNTSGFHDESNDDSPRQEFVVISPDCPEASTMSPEKHKKESSSSQRHTISGAYSSPRKSGAYSSPRKSPDKKSRKGPKPDLFVGKTFKQDICISSSGTLKSETPNVRKTPKMKKSSVPFPAKNECSNFNNENEKNSKTKPNFQPFTDGDNDMGESADHRSNDEVIVYKKPDRTKSTDSIKSRKQSESSHVSSAIKKPPLSPSKDRKSKGSGKTTTKGGQNNSSSQDQGILKHSTYLEEQEERSVFGSSTISSVSISTASISTSSISVGAARKTTHIHAINKNDLPKKKTGPTDSKSVSSEMKMANKSEINWGEIDSIDDKDAQKDDDDEGNGSLSFDQVFIEEVEEPEIKISTQEDVKKDSMLKANNTSIAMHMAGNRGGQRNRKNTKRFGQSMPVLNYDPTERSVCSMDDYFRSVQNQRKARPNNDEEKKKIVIAEEDEEIPRRRSTFGKSMSSFEEVEENPRRRSTFGESLSALDFDPQSLKTIVDTVEKQKPATSFKVKKNTRRSTELNFGKSMPALNFDPTEKSVCSMDPYSKSVAKRRLEKAKFVEEKQKQGLLTVSQSRKNTVTKENHALGRSMPVLNFNPTEELDDDLSQIRSGCSKYDEPKKKCTELSHVTEFDDPSFSEVWPNESCNSIKEFDFPVDQSVQKSSKSKTQSTSNGHTTDKYPNRDGNFWDDIHENFTFQDNETPKSSKHKSTQDYWDKRDHDNEKESTEPHIDRGRQKERPTCFMSSKDKMDLDRGNVSGPYQNFLDNIKTDTERSRSVGRRTTVLVAHDKADKRQENRGRSRSVGRRTTVLDDKVENQESRHRSKSRGRSREEEEHKKRSGRRGESRGPRKHEPEAPGRSKIRLGSTDAGGTETPGNCRPKCRLDDADVMRAIKRSTSLDSDAIMGLTNNRLRVSVSRTTSFQSSMPNATPGRRISRLSLQSNMNDTEKLKYFRSSFSALNSSRSRMKMEDPFHVSRARLDLSTRKLEDEDSDEEANRRRRRSVEQVEGNSIGTKKSATTDETTSSTQTKDYKRSCSRGRDRYSLRKEALRSSSRARGGHDPKLRAKKTVEEQVDKTATSES